jgi:hypothetical protein
LAAHGETKEDTVIETYRLLGEERRADLDREAARLHFGAGRRKRSKGPLIVLAVVAVAAAIALAGGGPSFGAGSGPTYLQVSSFSSSLQNDNLAVLSATTEGAIQRQPDAFINSNPVVGIAWADLDTGKVFLATIHPVLGRDSNQNPDSWHAHTATLVGGASGTNDYCVASIDSTPTAGIQIHGNEMDVNVRSDALPVTPSAFDAALGFTVQPDSACASGLAVRAVS